MHIDAFIRSLFNLTFQAPKFHEFLQVLKLLGDHGNDSAVIKWFIVPSPGFFFFQFSNWHLTLAV